MRAELIGGRVTPRPLTPDDLPQRAEWTADNELAVLMGVDPAEEPFVSPEHELRRNRQWLQGRRADGDVFYAVEVEGRYIGDVDVFLARPDGVAELSVCLGERAAWNKGYGTETVRLVLGELARDGAVSAVELDVPAGDDRALRFWQKLGFGLTRADDQGRRWLRLAIDQQA